MAPCGGIFVREDGALLVTGAERGLWAGTSQGVGEWVDAEQPIVSYGGPDRKVSLGDEALIVVQGPNSLARLDWEGSLVAWREFRWSGETDLPAIAWSGSVLGVAFREFTDERNGVTTDRAFFQRFDADLEPIDPDPFFLMELDSNGDPPQGLHPQSPILVGWDGSEFGTVVAHTIGRNDWGVDPPIVEVYRFREEGGLVGSFTLGPPIDPLGGEYSVESSFDLFDVPEAARTVILQTAVHWVPDGPELEPDWAGTNLSALDLATGSRVGENGRLSIGGPKARSGGRLGVTWVDGEFLDEAQTEWIEHLMFTVLDCSSVFGEL
ncbi:MAG: hypothetical protein HYY06_09645 [Deltaproteobacteria bacterium]|nr:hypothetical protein [Deltaproteobacteria bacterium]